MKGCEVVNGYSLDNLGNLKSKIAASLPFHVTESREGRIGTRLAPHVTARFAGSDVGQIVLQVLPDTTAQTIFPGAIVPHCLRPCASA
jgi:hypothetical protein